MTATMKAAWYEKFGSPEVLQIGEMPIPEVQPNEVLIRLHASGINPSDVKRRQGIRENGHYSRIIPHSDGAGVIEKVGSQISKERIGQRVWTYNARWERAFGTAAEYVALPAELAISLPENVSFETGACLGIPAMAAHRAVFVEGPVKDKTILVTGGAGTVSHYAIQLAKWDGATVITTVNNSEKAQIAKKSGADYILNYLTENIVEKINAFTKNKGVDHIIDVDFAANLPVTQEIIKHNGSISTYASMSNPTPTLPFYPLMYKGTNLHLIDVYGLPQSARKQAIQDINAALVSGALTSNIAKKFPLNEIIASHQLVEMGTVGQVILTI